MSVFTNAHYVHMYEESWYVAARPGDENGAWGKLRWYCNEHASVDV